MKEQTRQIKTKRLGFNPVKRAEKLRSGMIDLENKKVLLANFKGSSQSQDIPRVRKFGDFFRAKLYEKPEETKKNLHNFRKEPAGIAAEKLGSPWNQLDKKFLEDPWQGPQIQECNNVFLFQVNGCNLNCWYCYVDNINKSGNSKCGIYASTEEILMHFLVESRKSQFLNNPHRKINILRISGGDPMIVPEIIYWMIKTIEKFGLENYIYLWIDSNLTTFDFYWRYLSSKQREKIRNYKNIGFMGCYKGLDEEMFYKVTGAIPEFFKAQFIMHRWLLDEGLDVYSYLYPVVLSTNNLSLRIKRFIRKMQNEVGKLAPLRLTTPYIKIYSPIETDYRLTPERVNAIYENQHVAIKTWKKEMKKNYGPLADCLPHEIPIEGG